MLIAHGWVSQGGRGTISWNIIGGKDMKFLETITFSGEDALVPIDRIKFVFRYYGEHGLKIKIVTDDGEFEEGFDKNEDKANLRYEMIKKILKGA